MSSRHPKRTSTNVCQVFGSRLHKVVLKRLFFSLWLQHIGSNPFPKIPCWEKEITIQKWFRVSSASLISL